MLDVVNPLQNTSYTNKDFASIYPELLDLVKELTAVWDPSISNESDPGVVLLKLNAIIADKLSYNSDTNVLELFPLSVTQEKNARQLFEQLGYYMHWYQGAITDISMAWIGDRDANASYTIPAFSIVTDYNNTISYTLIGPSDGMTINTYKVGNQLLPLNGDVISFKAIQGIPVQYTINSETLITVANLDSNNRLYFPTSDVAENGIFITNAGLNNYTSWQKVGNLLVQPVSEAGRFYKFGVAQDTSTCYLEFPENAEELFKGGINITYIKTLGEGGNISYGVIEKFYNELSPAENSGVVFTLDNVKMLNYSSAVNGKDPQQINDAYRDYKSTIGVFEVLVTLRDYISYILNTGLVSNCFVCDRTNDPQSTYKVMTSSNDIDSLITEVDLNADDQNLLTAFDLKLYLLQLPKTEMDNASAYNTTFAPMNNAEVSNVEAYISDIKCISHDYSPILPRSDTRSHFCFFKNKYPISCRITPQYQLTKAAAEEVQNRVVTALYEALNAAEVDFGADVPYDFIYNTIIKADERIKSIILNNIVYTTYAVYLDGTTHTYYEVPISEPDENEGVAGLKNLTAKFNVSVEPETFTNKLWSEQVGSYKGLLFTCVDTSPEKWRVEGTELSRQDLLDEYGITLDDTKGSPRVGDIIQVVITPTTQIRDEIYTKSVLAGVTQFFIQDEKQNLRLDQFEHFSDTDICSSVKRLATNLVTEFNPETTYKLRANEYIQLFAPNLVDSATFSTYVKFEYRLTQSLLDGVDYKLTGDEYFIMYWLESQTSELYRYAVYGAGNIIKLDGFNLAADSGDSNVGGSLADWLVNIGTSDSPILYTDDEMNNRMTLDISKKLREITNSTNPDKVLSTVKKIVVRRLNQLFLQPGQSFCFWILNEKITTDLGDAKYRLFEAGGEYQYTFSPGEYFIFTDSSFTNLTILGAGSLIERSNNAWTWEVSVKDASTILENGINAFTENDWFKIPSDSSATLTEQYFINVGEDSLFKLRLSRNKWKYLEDGTDFVSNDWSSTLNPRWLTEPGLSDYGKRLFLNAIDGYGSIFFYYQNSIRSWTYQGSPVQLTTYGVGVDQLADSALWSTVSSSAFTSDYYYTDLRGADIGTVVDTTQTTSAAGFSYYALSCTNDSGLPIQLKVQGNNYVFDNEPRTLPLWAALDAEGKIIALPTGDYSEETVVTIPSNTRKVLFQTSPESGSTFFALGRIPVLEVTIPEWQLEIDREGVWFIQEEDGVPTRTSINLGDFDPYYTQPNSSVFNKVTKIDVGSEAFNWDAATRLALNMTRTKEQILLSDQSITCYLGDTYAYKFESAPDPTPSTIYFEAGSKVYKAEIPESLPKINYILFNENSDVILINHVALPYEEAVTFPANRIHLSNEYVIEGADYTSGQYPVALYSNYDLITDGSQRITTYQYDQGGELTFLSFYVHTKQETLDTDIYYSSDGKIEVTFRPTVSSKTLNFSLPGGEYILPISLGGSELAEEGGYLKIRFYYNNAAEDEVEQDLHTMGSDDEDTFSESKKYFLYLNVPKEGTDDNAEMSLTLKIHNATLTKNLTVILYDIYKYYHPENFNSFEISKIRRLLRAYDKDNLYNYTYVVDPGDEIKDPLQGESFFLSNHIYNKFTLPQMETREELGTSILIAGKK